MRVLVFGDSIGQGFYDATSGGWVQKLQRDYFAEEIEGKSEVNIFNLSISGDTSNEVLSRLQNEASARQNSDEMLTVIAIGVNDSYEKNGVRRTSEEKFASNLEEIIKIGQSFGKVIILGCSACVDARVQPTSWDSTLHYSNELLRVYEAILEECSKKTGVEFVPLWQITNDAQQLGETLPDGIHPNTEGHNVIYSAVKEKMRALV